MSFFDRMLVSAGKDLKEPLLIALAEREDGNRSGKMVVCYHLDNTCRLQGGAEKTEHIRIVSFDFFQTASAT